MLRATLDALKNKGNTNCNPVASVGHLNPPKRTKVEDSESDDEEEIMALLDEIDRTNPLPLSTTSFLSTTSKIRIQEPPPLLEHHQSDLDLSTSDLGDMTEVAIGASSITAAQGLENGNNTNFTISPTFHSKDIMDKVNSTLSTQPPLEELLQFMPFPFFPEAFSISDWNQNVQAIKSTFSFQDFSNLVSISSARSMRPPGSSKCSLMLIMIREVQVCARDIGVKVLDGTGEMQATIHEKVLTLNRIRAHFGMTLLVANVTSFVLDNKESEERHLIITPNNVLKIFSNVHQLQ